jgi:hypothetical protein
VGTLDGKHVAEQKAEELLFLRIDQEMRRGRRRP